MFVDECSPALVHLGHQGIITKAASIKASSTCQDIDRVGVIVIGVFLIELTVDERQQIQVGGQIGRWVFDYLSGPGQLRGLFLKRWDF
ncbi:MAG: hypothetical protein [Olavius algarvensis spirochete endosymbiont]|nr:MAG: hypothetical protein [Olavius algarvensis spirochete endosymbiont]